MLSVKQGGIKYHFTIATTRRCRLGRYSIPWCRILVSSQPTCKWTGVQKISLRIWKWIDITHVNVLGRSILVKWTDPHAAPALSNKRGGLSWLAFPRRQPNTYLAFAGLSGIPCRMGYRNQWQIRGRKAPSFRWATLGWASCKFCPLCIALDLAV